MDPDVQDLQYDDVIYASCADKEVGGTSKDGGNGHLCELLDEPQMDILEVGFTTTDEQNLDPSKHSDVDVEDNECKQSTVLVCANEVSGLFQVQVEEWCYIWVCSSDSYYIICRFKCCLGKNARYDNCT